MSLLQQVEHDAALDLVALEHGKASAVGAVLVPVVVRYFQTRVFVEPFVVGLVGFGSLVSSQVINGMWGNEFTSTHWFPNLITGLGIYTICSFQRPGQTNLNIITALSAPVAMMTLGKIMTDGK